MDLLATVAKSLNGTSDPDDVLAVVVHATRDLLDVGRASILLLDDEGLLVPTVSAARHEDQALFKKFRAMRPLTSALSPAGRLLLAGTRAVAIDRVAESPLVPAEWREQFGLESLALVPLVAHDRTRGVLVVDAPAAGCFRPQQLATLEAVGALASLAVRNAESYALALERSEHLTRVLAVAEALNDAPSRHRVLETAHDAVAQVFGAQSSSINVLSSDLTAFTTLSSRGAGQPAPGRHHLAEIDPNHVDALRSHWLSDPTGTVVYDVGGRPQPAGPFDAVDASATGVLLPLTQEGRVRGFAVVGLPDGIRPTREQLELGTSVVGQVWLALERARLTASLQRRAAIAELLHALDEALVLVPDMRTVVERLAPALREETGGELLDIRLVDPAAARLFGAAACTGRLASAVRSWACSPDPAALTVDGIVVAPMLLGADVVGALRVRSVGDDVALGDSGEFLAALAAGVAGAVARALLRNKVGDSERDLAVAEERERVGQDLHVNVGGVLSAAADRLRKVTLRPAGPVARDDVAEALSLVTAARRQIRNTTQSLSSLHLDRRGLAPALRELGRTWTTTSGIPVQFRLVGPPRQLPAASESVVLRVTHEALTNVGSQSHASVVLVRLRYCSDRLELTVRDNGVRLAQRASAPELHAGLRAMKSRVGDLGGFLEIDGSEEVGLRMTATLPYPPT